ncbi:MAG TPA: hypothetical protein VFA38_06265 [Nitrospirales bacterium]|nr:hypothetical protein [Nitrospirales bacterium]
MTPSERCEGVIYLGLQDMFDGTGVPLFWDPETGTSFVVHERESLAEALIRVSERFAMPAEPTKV